ncbi:MAG: hypothetical protein ABSH51_02855 [Solirubrobacteraceae bacterium]
MEPLAADDPLTRLENAVPAPNLGSVSEVGFRHMYRQVVHDVTAFRGGQPIRTLA